MKAREREGLSVCVKVRNRVRARVRVKESARGEGKGQRGVSARVGVQLGGLERGRARRECGWGWMQV